MQNFSIKTKTGFTLVEVMGSLTLLVIAMTMALAGYMLLLKNNNRAGVQHELDIDVQLAIESLKTDLRLSSMDEIFGYPEGSPPYEAISFPVARINPATGRLNRDPVTREIIWDETIIYHVVDGSPNELTKTTFKNRIELSDADRQTQLNMVVENNGPQGGVNNQANASSKIIFSNLLNWGIDPQKGTFSGYAPTANPEKVSLGYALLNAGQNTVTFKVTGRNPKNTADYKIGIDQILASPVYRYREAEKMGITYSGTNPKINIQPSYGNRREILLENCNVGDSFTLTIPNDRWELTDFRALDGGGYTSHEHTKVSLDRPNEDIVLSLEGNESTWDVMTQTGDAFGHTTTTNINGARIKVMLKGSNLLENGGSGSNGEQVNLTFRAASNSNVRVSNVWFGESAYSNTTTMAFSTANPAVQAFFSTASDVEITKNTPRSTDWIDYPIDRKKNYMVSFNINDSSELHVWNDYNALSYTPYADATTQITIGTNTFKAYIVPVLQSAQVSYVDEGIYTSDIMDTMLANPTYNELSWDSSLPAGTEIAFRVRTGNDPDLENASYPGTWKTISNTSGGWSINSNTGRYIQFQTRLKSDSATNLKTPILREVTTSWAGERRMVNIMGNMSKGPDFGDFELSVNGKPLQSAVIVNLEIYEKARGLNDQNVKVSSSIRAEITPRNSSSL